MLRVDHRVDLPTDGVRDATAVTLPSTIRVALFDLDGVLTRTATLHAQAWKTMFDDILSGEGEGPGAAGRPFDIDADYRRYVDGLPRLDGVRSFLASRGIDLPEGDPDDGPDERTVVGLGARKNDLFNRLLAEHGPDVIEPARAAVERFRAAGIRCAIVSSSANARAVVDAAGMDGLFDVIVDGVVRTNEHLSGKPAPDTFLRAAHELGVEPGEAVVFEDAESGVAAGRSGGFGLVIGVGTPDRVDALVAAGADHVVADLTTVTPA